MAAISLKVALHPELCVGCGYCQLWCSFVKTRETSISKSRIGVERLGYQERYTVFLKDDCDHCGVCAEFCFYGALEAKG